MTKKEQVEPELDMKVFHENVDNGRTSLKIVGIRKTEVELEGGSTKSWLPIKGTFRLRKVCEQVEKFGTCQLHNLHCGYPNCEPFINSAE